MNGTEGMNTAAIFRGNLFELAAHGLLLLKGSRSPTLMSCHHLARLKQRRQVDGLENPPPPPLGQELTMQWFKDLSEDFPDGVYCRPTKSNLAAVDSFVRLVEGPAAAPAVAAVAATPGKRSTRRDVAAAAAAAVASAAPVKHLVLFQMTVGSLDGIVAAVTACGSGCQHVHLVFVLPDAVNPAQFANWQSYTRAGHVVPFDDMSDAEQDVIARVHQWVLRLEWPALQQA